MTTVVLNTVTRKVEVFSSARDVHARAEIADHKAAANPHPQYLADADLAEVALSGDAGDLTAGTVPDARMPNWTGYSVASRAALQSANVPAAVDGLTLLGYSTVGDGGGAHYRRVASEPAHPHKIQSADGAWWEEIFAVDLTVNIPSHFPTLQDAIDRLSKQPVRQGVSIILNIESGHQPSTGIYVENGDYGHFTIASDDAAVTLAAGWGDTQNVIHGVGAIMPKLNCLIDADNQGQIGYLAEYNSVGQVGSGCGVINIGSPTGGSGDSNGVGLRASRTSRITAPNCIFSNARSRGVWVTRGSTVDAEFGDFSNAGGLGGYISRSSVFYAAQANFTGAGIHGVQVSRSLCTVREANLSGAALSGINAFEGSIVLARLATINNCGANGVRTFQGGAFVDVNAATITGSGANGISAEAGGTVNIENATVTGSTGVDLYVAGGGTIHAGNGAVYGSANQTTNVLTGAGTIFDDSEDSYPSSDSNANGDFTKFADGTMICRTKMKAEYDTAITLRASWTFPAGFTSNDAYSWTANMQKRSPANISEGIADSAKQASVIMETVHSSTSLTLDVRAPSGSGMFSAGDFLWLSITATGWWK